MAIERYTENTVILPGEWVIPVEPNTPRRALPPRQVINVVPYGVMLKDASVFVHKSDIVFVCDTEAEGQSLYEAITAFRDKRERAIREVNQRLDIEMQSALDMIIHTANYKE